MYTSKNAQFITNLQRICGNAVPTTCHHDVFKPSVLACSKVVVTGLQQDCCQQANPPGQRANPRVGKPTAGSTSQPAGSASQPPGRQANHRVGKPTAGSTSQPPGQQANRRVNKPTAGSASRKPTSYNKLDENELATA